MKYEIITAMSGNMWDDYLLFNMSLMRHNSYTLKVMAFDINQNQKEFISNQLNTILYELKDDEVEYLKTIDNDWKKWYKPLFFTRMVDNDSVSIWIDCDVIITGKLDELFQLAADKFVVFSDYFAPKYCQNKTKLYELCDVIPKSSKILNSGVFGGSFDRDNGIIKLWLDNVKKAHDDKTIYDNITLHDQGALLLTMHQLDIINNIQNNKKWNYPAKRLFYDKSCDIVDSVKDDHPDATIVHYAGIPKLSHLKTIDHQKSITYFRSKCGNYDQVTDVVSGADHLLRGLITILKDNARYGGYFKYVESPELIQRVNDVNNSIDFNLNVVDRHDCPYVCLASPQYGPLSKHIKNANNILVLSDLIEIIKHKLITFSVSHSLIHHAPFEYQSKYGDYIRSNRTAYYINRHRILVNNDSDLIDSCVDEILWSVDKTLSYRDDNLVIVWANNCIELAESITNKVRRLFNISFCDNSQLINRKSEWFDDEILKRSDSIRDKFYKLLMRYDIKMTKLIP